MKVVVVNAYADDNRGSAALTDAAITWARLVDPSANLKVVPIRRLRTSPASFRHTLAAHPDVEVVAPLLLPRVGPEALFAAVAAELAPSKVLSDESVNAIRDADLVVSRGGVIFHARSRRDLASLATRLLGITVAHRFGTPVVAFGAHIEVPGPALARRLLARALTRCMEIHPRGLASQAAARSLGCAPSRTKLLPDSVFLLGGSARGTRTAPGGQPRVAITVGPAGGERWREVQCAQVDAIRRLLEREVVARVMAVSQVEGHDDDDSEMLEHLLRLIAELPHEVAARDLSVRALMDLYSGAEVQIGSRVHSTILSAASGTPGIAMQTDGRAREIFDLVGLGQLVLDPFIPHQVANRLAGMDLDGERAKTAAAATNAAETTRAAAEALRERL